MAHLALGAERIKIIDKLRRDFYYSESKADAVLTEAAQRIRDLTGVEPLPESGKSAVRLQIIVSEALKAKDFKTALAAELELKKLSMGAIPIPETETNPPDPPESETPGGERHQAELVTIYEAIDQYLDFLAPDDLNVGYIELIRLASERILTHESGAEKKARRPAKRIPGADNGKKTQGRKGDRPAARGGKRAPTKKVPK